jgi:biotin carboxylase
MTGDFVGVDTLSVDRRHRVIGLHRKRMFEPPSFAMRGSSFSAEVPAEVERYVLALLDAVGFDWGATHIELMLTREGPRLIEINPRLVGARMPRLVSHALGRSLHTDLIAVHLGQEPPAAVAQDNAVGAIRWVVAAQRGVLNAVHLPDWTDPRIRCVDILKQSGDGVGPPFENADRIGCVMACAPSAAEAESLAERYVAGCRVEFQSTKAPVLQPA